MSKVCTKCQREKPDGAFYKHPMSRGGLQAACKECAKAAVRANRKKRIEYYREYDRLRAMEPHRVKARKEYAEANPRSRAEKDPVKRQARVTLGNAVRDGTVKKPPHCEICRAECSPHGHHDDYNKPLDVIWVCRPCHALIHAYWRAQDRKAA